jgi:hypothetical protein
LGLFMTQAALIVSAALIQQDSKKGDAAPTKVV